MSNQILSFALHTLGCKLNYSESSTISRQLKDNGLTQKNFDEYADTYILNTCSVTENADKECLQLIKKIQNKNADAFIVVTGCYAQLQSKRISEMAGVDLVLGANEKFNIVEHIKNLSQKGDAKIHSCDIDSVTDFVSAFSFQDRTRAFLKIQDGCDYSCTYCTIPQARGMSRSDSLQNVLQNIETLRQNNVKEIVLTGVNLGDYTHNNQKFIDVIKNIENSNTNLRFRISSIEPNLITDEIVDIVAKSNAFMPHFHIPLQSGSNKILGLMRRRYQRELYANKIEYIKKNIPHCSIGVDVIVGFPDESEKDFNDTFEFLHQLDVSYLHVFTYSERPNTAAIDIKNSVPMHVRKSRNKILRSLSLKKSNYFKNQHLHSFRKVLFESRLEDNTIEGFTDNYIKVKTLYQPNLENQILNWQVL